MYPIYIANSLINLKFIKIEGQISKYSLCPLHIKY